MPEILNMAKLYLIPNQLNSGTWVDVLPLQVKQVIADVRYYIVENVRNARRFLKKLDKEIDIDSLTFFELNQHTAESDLPDFLSPLEHGNNLAIISEAGCPGVADPGAAIVKLAHLKGFRVVPLVGPSSILLALMASGMNGQNFSFLGYLPVKYPQRIDAIRRLERDAWDQSSTQLFIETPYRNNQLMNDLLKTCRNDTLLGVAADLTGENEFIAVAPIGEWKKKKPDLHHRPAVFMVYRG